MVQMAPVYVPQKRRTIHREWYANILIYEKHLLKLNRAVVLNLSHAAIYGNLASGDVGRSIGGQE